MNRISFVAAAVITVVAAPAPQLRAQTFSGRPVQVGLMGGFTIPAGDLSSAANHSGNAGALVTIGAPESHLRFRLDAQWQRITGNANYAGLSCPSCVIFSYQRNYRVLDATANAVYGGTVSRSVSLYMIGGVGVYAVRGTSIIRQDDLVVSESSSATRFGFNGGVGMSVRLGHLATFVEARYHQLLGSRAYENDGLNGPVPGAFKLVPISVGIVF